MNEIVTSAEFWTMIADVVVSTVLYFGAKYLAVPSCILGRSTSRRPRLRMSSLW